MIGAIIGWFFLGLLALLLLLIFAPLVVTVRFKKSVFYVWVRVLGIKFSIIPLKPAKKEKEGKKEKKKKPEKKPARKRSVQDWSALGKRMLSSLDAFSKYFLRKIKVRRVEVVLPVKGADAAATASSYSMVQGLLGTARAFLENFLNIKYKRLVVFADFAGTTTSDNIYFSCKIIASPAIMIAAAFKGLKRFFVIRKKWGRNVPRKQGSKPAAKAQPLPQPIKDR